MPKQDLPKPNKSGNLRGTNPRSRGNHNKGGKKKSSVSLLPETWERSRLLGDSYSNGIDNGIDRLFAILPVSVQAKVIIELSLEHLPENKAAIAEAVLLKLEDLEIETLYKECEIEGTLPEPKSGAWII